MTQWKTEGRAGFLYGAAAYGLWGLVPLYFRTLRHVTPWELLAHRIAWSAVLLAGLMFILRGWDKVRRALGASRTRHALLLTSVLIGINWCLYIYAASRDQVVQASLGYFIAPLVNTGLGVFVLGERLRRLQIGAIVLATIGVATLTLLQGEFPWLAIGLAVSFSFYGLLRKTVAADALTGLTVETFILTPLAVGYIFWIQWAGLAQFAQVGRGTDLLLVASSVVTVVPLFCFAQAARRLRLTTIGFLQFLSPTVQFFLAVTVLNEPFDNHRLAGFVPIWLALLVYVGDALLHARRIRAAHVAVTLPE